MGELSIEQAVERFAQVTSGASEADLERAWAWGDYDSEGVRFAHFRTYEELRELAVTIKAQRSIHASAASQAQCVLAQYHSAYRDMLAALIGVKAEDADRAPAPGEWPVRQVVAHIVQADMGFYVAVRFALERHRSGAVEPARITTEAWEELVGLDEASFDAILQGPLIDLLRYQRLFHQRIIDEFSGITDAELELPSLYWEGHPYSLRFRLGRFDSHMRQHTVQIDKTLAALNLAPGESKRLLRLIYAALADAEGSAIGAQEIGVELSAPVASAIVARADELAAILAAPA